MGFAKIKGALASRVGCAVRFTPPADVRDLGGCPAQGEIVDEVWATPEINLLPPRQRGELTDWGDYSFCSQLIRWTDGQFSIRLAYYRRRAGENHWEFASQMTVNSDRQTVAALLQRTLERRGWFDESPVIDAPHLA